MSVGAIEAGKLNVVLPGVRPVNTIIDEVQGQSVGPSDFVLYDHAPVGAVHADPPNVRVITPVWPVQEPEVTRQRQWQV